MAASASVNGDMVMVMAEEPGLHRQRDRDSGWNIPFSELVDDATAAVLRPEGLLPLPSPEVDAGTALRRL